MDIILEQNNKYFMNNLFKNEKYWESEEVKSFIEEKMEYKKDVELEYKIPSIKKILKNLRKLELIDSKSFIHKEKRLKSRSNHLFKNLVKDKRTQYLSSLIKEDQLQSTRLESFLFDNKSFYGKQIVVSQKNWGLFIGNLSLVLNNGTSRKLLFFDKKYKNNRHQAALPYELVLELEDDYYEYENYLAYSSI